MTDQPLGMSRDDIASSIYRNDVFIRWPSLWIEVTGPRLAVLFALLGFLDLMVIAAHVSGYSVDMRDDWAGLSLTFGIRPIVWSIYGWMPFAMGNVLTQLRTSGVVRDQNAQFDALVRRSCHQLGGVWLTGGAAGFGVVTQMVVAIFFSPEGFPPWGDPYDLRFWVFSAPMGAITWYATAKILVRAALFSLVLTRLFGSSSAIVITVPAMHPDGAGGLGSIGRYAVGMSLLALMALGYLTIVAIRSVTGVDLTDEGVRPIHFVLSMVALYPLAVWLYLFAPLWLVHQAMLKERYAELLDISTGVDRHRDALLEADTGGDLAPRLERIRQLEEAYELIIRTSPRWPFSRTTLGYLGAINLLALTSTILGIVLSVRRIFLE